MRILSRSDAIELVPSNGTVAISGGGYRGEPEGLLAGIEERHAATGMPHDLTVIAISMIERTRGGVGGEGTGLNRFAATGLMSRLISGSFSRAPERDLNVLIDSDQIEAYNVPMGTIVQWLRSIGSGRRSYMTPVGLGTFVDPRLGGGAANSRAAAHPLSTIVEIDGEELIRYPRLRGCRPRQGSGIRRARQPLRRRAVLRSRCDRCRNGRAKFRRSGYRGSQ